MEGRRLCFCYGSNSVTQLKQRVQNDQLVAHPAFAPGWRRVFAGDSSKWGGGGTASILPAPGAADARVNGSVVYLTMAEFDRLDR